MKLEQIMSSFLYMLFHIIRYHYKLAIIALAPGLIIRFFLNGDTDIEKTAQSMSYIVSGMLSIFIIQTASAHYKHTLLGYFIQYQKINALTGCKDTKKVINTLANDIKTGKTITQIKREGQKDYDSQLIFSKIINKKDK